MTAPDAVPFDRLREHLATLGIDLDGAVLEPLGDGHSNLTYLIRTGEQEIVLRRPPLGELAPSTHDVLREARILRGLEGLARVPRVLYMCADVEVIGAPFYLMGFVPGVALFDSLPGGWQEETAGRVVAEEFINALVDLHGIDWAGAGLSELGRPDGYLERQLRRFKSLSPAGDAPGARLLDELHRWLNDRLPPSGGPTLVHGDYRLGNVLFSDSEPVRLAVILDWEMAALGDPLTDLGFVTALWSSPPGRFDLNPITRLETFPPADDLIARYARATGRDVGAVGWYQVLALWKLAILIDRLTRRTTDGAPDDPLIRAHPDAVLDLADRAWDMTRETI